MFSRRVPQDLGRNRLTRAVDQMRAERRPFVDLTLSNPTRAGFAYPPDLLAPLSQADALRYAPSPLGLEHLAHAPVVVDDEDAALHDSVERVGCALYGGHADGATPAPRGRAFDGRREDARAAKTAEKRPQNALPGPSLTAPAACSGRSHA